MSVGVGEIVKLLNTGYGQFAIILGIIHLLNTSKSMTKEFKALVESIKVMEAFIIRQQVFNETRDKSDLAIKVDIDDLEQRMRVLEKGQTETPIN